MLFDDNNFDVTFLNISGITNPNKEDLLESSKIGFLKGNMFKNEYIPYKNYTYMNIEPKTEKEAALLNVMQYSFAINDLNLYLDLHPDDNNMHEVFKMLVENELKAREEYISKYGSLEVCDSINSRFNWLEDWPWEGNGGSMYV